MEDSPSKECINVGIVTKVKKSLIKDIVKEYYDIELLSVSPITKFGISDTSYFASSIESRSYFIKVYESTDFDKAELEARLTCFLSAGNFPVSDAIPMLSHTKDKSNNKGRVFIAKVQNKPLGLFRFVLGCSPYHIRRVHIREIAYFLAKLHSQSFNSSLNLSLKELRQYSLKSRILSLIKKVLIDKSPFQNEAKGIFLPFLYIVDSVDYNENNSLIHTDLFPDNTHFASDKLIGVFDFTSFAYGCTYFDIAVVIISWCMYGNVFKTELVNFFISSYNNSNKEHTVSDIKLFNWIKLSSLFYALKRYYMQRVLKQTNLNGKTYKEYINKLLAMEWVLTA